MIPYGKQSIDQNDIDSVVKVLKSDFLTQGPMVPLFEGAIAEKVGVNHAVAVNSATSALHLACLALNVGKGDIVWTSPITFVASANCALYCDASIDFIDIDPKTFNICLIKLEKKLQKAELDKKIPKVVIPVHLCGTSCDMEAIYQLSKRFGFHIIEDASHAIGGYYQGIPIGSCKYSDITIFSFHPVKIITTAEGGMAVTACSDLADKMILLRNHGITRDTEQMTHESDGPWYYQQISLGFNYRMTDIQAALGLSQLSRLDEFVEDRNKLATRYKIMLDSLPVSPQYIQKYNYSSFHLYVIRIELNKTHLTYREIFERLRAKGIGVNVHYIPIHTQPFYKTKGFKKGDFPSAEAYYENAMSLPIFHYMSQEQQNKVVKTLQDILG
ncbi:UDP-4-amino-4,6-dideoxy-N-acetyl-beta-L-altrosamine transaminase [Endozoicomonas sp. SM1973]|uniref:UDP-4-amino-4, 6-dideoxy-N-acetyl-beta-L-altrosamine transaminase n=1 Tax=Spartinivicinus marinus TaxID=2994442 RepID=A0A853I4L0_9GAMM|nr:UDP-4-amino-4,6-dideoxy-N-acetyl-beta-L-altrosamine transaminase [Spartinivicinus marinus]MCX4028796.1 UDP-4-amino-4,6-dideoxy-N-acetyl-beta-L-altrosamine transaminase [Spartinivicinus marinus]NYZ67609.1 UDP-4-amino-4,6-dideoxy-N-acetyl-beta-L-altrosamine transaminase [Spartinivicinus marinus]